MMPVISEKKLVELLESKSWFKEGTPKLFIKLLEANSNGANLHTLTGIIWACSDNVSRDEIYKELYRLEQAELDEFVSCLLITHGIVDDDALVDDPYICYEMV